MKRNKNRAQGNTTLTVSLPAELLKRVDELVGEAGFDSRSNWIRNVLKKACKEGLESSGNPSRTQSPSTAVVGAVAAQTGGRKCANGATGEAEKKIS